MKKPTAWEQKVLDVCLKELRRSVKLRAQLTITIDPFVRGGGAHIFAAPNEEGHTYIVEGKHRMTKELKATAEILAVLKRFDLDEAISVLAFVCYCATHREIQRRFWS